jgi:hypothetical protein
MENTKKLDVVEDAILQAYQTNRNKRQRVQIRMDRFKDITLLEVLIGNPKKPDELKTRIRLFYNGDEVNPKRETWGYNLNREQRTPIIQKMLVEGGYTQTRIAEMLKVHVSTVHKDVRYMRYETTMLADYEFRPSRTIAVVKTTPAVSRRKTNTGESHVVH